MAMFPMARPLVAAMLGAGLMWAGAAQALPTIYSVDFNEPGVMLVPSDPTINGFSFSAGNALVFGDTITEDFQTPGNAYLLSGLDNFGVVGTSDTTFIKFTHSTLGGAGMTTTINLDAELLFPLPSGSILQLDVLLGNVVQDGTSFTCSSNPCLNAMSVTLNNLQFDEVRLFDTAAIGSYFRIDNLVVTVNDNTGGPGPGTVPEPASFALVGLGLIGLGMIRRQRKQAV